MPTPIGQIQMTHVHNVYEAEQCKNCSTWFVPEGGELICSKCSLPKLENPEPKEKNRGKKKTKRRSRKAATSR